MEKRALGNEKSAKTYDELEAARQSGDWQAISERL